MTTISNSQVFYNNDDPALATTAIEIDSINSQLILGRNLTTTPEYITISPNSIGDGTNSTPLSRITLLQEALASIEIPPNDTTLQINNKIIATNGTNTITIDASLNDIIITDGTTTNIITKNGMTTHNTNQNTTHFLNFVANSTTGSSQIQKTTGIECNPSTKTITATTFVGDLSGNATTATRATNIAGGAGGSIPYQSSANTTALLANGNLGQVLTSNGTTNPPTWTTPSVSTIAVSNVSTNATFYPTFVSANTGSVALNVDSSFCLYNPSTNVFQNPAFLVSNGTTQTATAGGLVINPTSISRNGITTTSIPLDIKAESVVGSTTRKAQLILNNNSFNSGIPQINLTAEGLTTNAGGKTSEIILSDRASVISGRVDGDIENLQTGLSSFDTDNNGNYASFLFNQNSNSFTYLKVSGLGVSIATGSGLTDTPTTIANFSIDNIVFYENLTFSGATGVLERYNVIAQTTGLTNLSVAGNAFKNNINTPTQNSRVLVLPNPSGFNEYWYGITNKSTSFTITIQYPSGTPIFTIPVSPAGGVGSFAKFAVVDNSAYYRCG